MNTIRPIRTPVELAEAGLVAPEELTGIEAVAERYAIAISPAMAALIDRNDPNDPIARQFVPTAAELEMQPGENADPIGDHPHSPVPGIVHRWTRIGDYVAEVNDARVFAGVHYRNSAEVGETMGRSIARHAVATLMTPREQASAGYAGDRRSDTNGLGQARPEPPCASAISSSVSAIGITTARTT